jgi:2-keto-myo-inositol isomerase
MKTCFNTITAGPFAPLDEVLSACGAAGFDGVEIELGALDRLIAERSFDAVKEQLAQQSLEVASLMAFSLEVFGDPSDALTEVSHAAELGAALGAPTLLVFCATGIPEGMSREDAIERAGEVAARYADAAAPLSIALEPIGRTGLMPGPDDALEIAAASGRENVGIMMDTFHYYLSEVPTERVRAIPREKLLIVHINDSEDRPVAELQDGHRLMPGLGVLPLVEDLRALHDLGYDGHLSLEIFRQEYWDQPIERTVPQAHAALVGVMEQAGVAGARR